MTPLFSGKGKLRCPTPNCPVANNREAIKNSKKLGEYDAIRLNSKRRILDLKIANRVLLTKPKTQHFKNVPKKTGPYVVLSFINKNIVKNWQNI